jgi:hypothetical protein
MKIFRCILCAYILTSVVTRKHLDFNCDVIYFLISVLGRVEGGGRST